MKKQYLISCYYEEYCQGYDEIFGYWLVNAISFEEACKKLTYQLRNANRFENRTID